jgi:hypothetical protein
MASIIDKALAQTLINAYRAQNSSTDGPALLTPDNQFLNGFFIDRNSLDSILSDSEVAGISIHFAKHPDFPTGDQRIFTIIFAGATPNPGYVKGNGMPPYLNTDHTWDQVEPCPPVCADLISIA